MVLPAALPEPDPRRAALAALVERVRPVVLAREQVLPVEGALAAVVPSLVRGSVLTVAGSGATSLALGLLAGASRAGSWTVVVGLTELAPAAVHDAGLDPARVAFVDPGTSGRHVDAIAALVGAVDLVLIDARLPIRPTDARRLTARSRERGSVMVVLQPGVDPSNWRVGASVPAAWTADVALTVRAESWRGTDDGHGHARERELDVRVTGRGRHGRGARHRLAFPAIDGTVRVLDPSIDGRRDATEVAGATVLPFVR